MGNDKGGSGEKGSLIVMLRLLLGQAGVLGAFS